MSEIPILSLPVRITEDEQLAFGLELAKKCRELPELREHRKSVAKSLQDEVDELESEIQRIRQIIETKKESRPVPVSFRRDYEKHSVETYRNDTGDLVSTRPMTHDERQQEMKFPTELDKTQGA